MPIVAYSGHGGDSGFIFRALAVLFLVCLILQCCWGSHSLLQLISARERGLFRGLRVLPGHFLGSGQTLLGLVPLVPLGGGPGDYGSPALALQAAWHRCLGLAVEQGLGHPPGLWGCHLYTSASRCHKGPCWGPALGLYWAFPFPVLWPEGVGLFCLVLVQDCWSSLQLLKHPVWGRWGNPQNSCVHSLHVLQSLASGPLYSSFQSPFITNC